jgi:outer membrane receptor protein involved in Fe transport
VEFGVSVPVTEKFRFRIAGKGEFMQGGYLRNTAADVVRDISPFETDALYPSRGGSFSKYPEQQQRIVRFTGVFEPNDNFDATFKFFYSRSKQNEAGVNTLYACADGVGGNPYLSNSFFDDPSTPQNESLIPDPSQTCNGKINFTRNSALPPREIADANPFLSADDEYFQRTTNYLATLEMNYQLGDITLTSVTGWWKYNQDEYTNYDYTSFAVVTSRQGESGESWTTEFRARSDWDFPVNFMVGVFYEDMTRDLDAPVQIFPLGPAPSGPWPSLYDGSHLTYHQHWDNWIKSFSAFGELRWQITDQLELSGGLRYTTEKRTATGGNIFNRLDTFLPPSVNPFSPSGVFYDLERKFNNTSPQATLSWKPQDDMLVYAAYKTGYQAAGISNPGTVPNIVNLTPEEQNDALTFDGSKVRGFEVGVKGAFFDNRLVGDLTVYRYSYKNLQVAVFDPTTTTFTVQNAAAAINKGIEGSLTFQATDDLQLRGMAQYYHLKYSSYTDAQCYPGQNDPSASTYRPELGALCTNDPTLGLIQDMSGERYGGGPFQFTIGFTYDTPISTDWAVALTADLMHTTKGKEILRQPGTELPSRTVLNTSLRLYQSGGPWEFSLICSNCTNERYVTGILNKPLGKTGDLTGSVGQPRLLTLQATYRW